MAKTRAERIESIQIEIAQLENQRKRLVQQQKEQERKDRTRRLCQRMGFFESMLPGTITLSDEHFKSFLEKTILTDHSRRILDGLTARNAAAPTANPADTAQKSGEDEGPDGGNGFCSYRSKKKRGWGNCIPPAPPCTPDKKCYLSADR